MNASVRFRRLVKGPSPCSLLSDCSIHCWQWGVDIAYCFCATDYFPLNSANVYCVYLGALMLGAYTFLIILFSCWIKLLPSYTVPLCHLQVPVYCVWYRHGHLVLLFILHMDDLFPSFLAPSACAPLHLRQVSQLCRVVLSSCCILRSEFNSFTLNMMIGRKGGTINMLNCFLSWLVAIFPLFAISCCLSLFHCFFWACVDMPCFLFHCLFCI